MKLIWRCFVSLALLTFPGLQATRSTLCVEHFKSPNYGAVARGARVQGDVRLKVTVGEDGRVKDASTLLPLADKSLTDDAVANIRQWTFTPGQDCEFEITYEFRLIMPETDFYPPSTVVVDFPSRVRITCNFATIMKD